MVNAMERFHVIDDGCVILRSRGVYRQVKLYYRGDELFAGLGAGFVKLMSRGGTSAPNVSWIDADPGARRITRDKLDVPRLAPPEE